MKNGEFESRKEQLEKGSLPVLIKSLKQDGCEITRRQRGMIKDELVMALILGVVEERSRILKLFRAGELTESSITKYSVYEVLGYGTDCN